MPISVPAPTTLSPLYHCLDEPSPAADAEVRKKEEPITLVTASENATSTGVDKSRGKKKPDTIVSIVLI